MLCGFPRKQLDNDRVSGSRRLSTIDEINGKGDSANTTAGNNTDNECSYVNSPVKNRLRLLFCENAGFTFVLDSGASRSMVSVNEIKPDRYFESSALAANEAAIRIFGKVTLHLKLNGQSCSWTFQVADVRGDI